VWVNLFGLVATSLIWLLANTVFDPREARRVFGFIGAAGIAGAILGGSFTEVAAPVLGTHNLLLVCLVALLGCTALTRIPKPLPERRASQRSQRRETHGALSAVRRSQLLSTMVPLVGLAGLVSVLIDIQFNSVVDESFATTDAKAAFFGRFFAVLYGLAFLFQLLLAPRILRKTGVGTALFVLPAALAAGSVALLLAPVMLTAVVAKAADGGLRHSLYRSATEILFLPVPVALKQKAKIMLDSTIDNVGTGLGALLALLLTVGLSLHYRYLSVLAVCAAVLWLGAAWRARRAYVDEFRQALSRRQIDPDQLRTQLSDAASVSSLVATLQGSNPRQLAYALDMLATVSNPAVVPPIRRLLDHPAAAIRARAVLALQQQPDTSALAAVESLLQDPDECVRVEAMHYICTRQRRSDTDRMRRFLATGDPQIQAAALGCIARYGGPEGAALLTDEFVGSVLAQDGPERVTMRCQLARALGHAPAAQSLKHLQLLCADESTEVIEATIEAAGHARHLDLAPWLVEQLANRAVRAAAGRALVSFGEQTLPALSAALEQRSPASSITPRQLIRVLGRINSQAAVDLLTRHLMDAPEPQRLAPLKALNKLRTSFPRLVFDAGRLGPLLAEETRRCAELRASGQHWPEPSRSPGERLLECALREKRADSLQRAFRILGLLYPPQDIYHAYLGVVSGNRIARASAVEFLDNVLERVTMRALLPMLEPESADTTSRTAPRAAPAAHWLVPLLGDVDPWLRTCAAYASDPSHTPELLPLLSKARSDPDPIVRETATLVLEGAAHKGALIC
jgi:AAA family ATP:ADP antiporter